jgi:hypothetical protein
MTLTRDCCRLFPYVTLRAIFHQRAADPDAVEQSGEQIRLPCSGQPRDGLVIGTDVAQPRRNERIEAAYPLKRSLGAAALALVEWHVERCAQPQRQHRGGERAVPKRRAQAGLRLRTAAAAALPPADKSVMRSVIV